MEHCIYCGCEELDLRSSFDCFKCCRCGLMFTRSGLDKDNKRLNRRNFYQGADNPDDRFSEDEVLDSAWALMEKSAWDQAEKTLFQRGYPFEHAMEFMLLREICLAAPLFERSEETRSKCLDIISGNLEKLPDYLPPNDNEQAFAILKRIYKALLLLGDLSFYCTTTYPERGRSKSSCHIDHTSQKRSDILEAYAAYLEHDTPKDDKRHIDCLKMAGTLLLKCFEQCPNKHGNLLLSGVHDEFLQISPSTSRRLSESIDIINSEISSLDPGFTPFQKPSRASEAVIPMWAYLSAAGLLPALLMYYAVNSKATNDIFSYILTRNIYKYTIFTVFFIAAGVIIKKYGNR